MRYHEAIKRAVLTIMGTEGIGTIAEVAIRAGTKRQTISKFLNSDGGTLRTLQSISGAINSTPGAILTLAEDILDTAAAKSAAAND